MAERLNEEWGGGEEGKEGDGTAYGVRFFRDNLATLQAVLIPNILNKNAYCSCV